MRLPPRYIEVLLPVWGERYTRDFLDFSLPSLLAPGNLPAISKLGACTFVLLAPARDAEVIQESSLWARLLDCCSVRVTYIDDLISQSSSTVLTLAYALVIRASGERALDTCFVPLVSDYVISDGSLRSVTERIFAGASGVLAGNFQVAREIVFPRLEECKSDTGVLAIAPRSLVDISLNALHRTTLAEIVNEGGGLSSGTNRLFWRVDERSMVGRFFLMHMIAIRPEISDFVISAPSDYSLVPELCPSGQIVRITDSDDYFVVECQPQGEGPQQAARGRIEPRSFAKALATWATAMHHDNGQHVLVFHAGVPRSSLAAVIATSNEFVSAVEASRDAPHMPFRNHPAWERSLDYHLATAQVEQDRSRLAAITGDHSLAKGSGSSSRLRSILLGRAPYFRRWHPRWTDVQTLKSSLAVAGGDVAIASDASARVRTWLDSMAIGQGRRTITHIRIAHLADDAPAGAAWRDAQFDCVFLVSDQAPFELKKSLSNLVPRVRPNGVLVAGIGRMFSETEHGLTIASVPGDLTLVDSRLRLMKVIYVTAGRSRVAIQTAMMQYARKSTSSAAAHAVLYLLAAGGLAVISMLINIAIARRRTPAKLARFSSLFFTFRRAEG
jgi:hypothetical protein